MASWRASRILKLVSPDATSHTQDNLVVKIDNTIVEDQHSTAKENAENVSPNKNIDVSSCDEILSDCDRDDQFANKIDARFISSRKTDNSSLTTHTSIIRTLQTNLVPDYDSDDSSINDNNNLENIETCTEIDQSIQKALPKSSSSSSSTSSSSSSNSTSSGSSSSDSDSSTSSKRTNQHSEQYANGVRPQSASTSTLPANISPNYTDESDNIDLSDDDPTFNYELSTKRKKKNYFFDATKTDSSDSDDDSVSDSDRKKLSKRGRKRSLNPAKWKQNKVKKLRNTGESYISISKSQKVIPSRCLKVPCTDKCRLKCTTNISMDERYNIFKEFWDLGDLTRQRVFISSCMVDITPKYRYTNATNPRRPNKAYNFTVNNKKIRVCKTFFKSTLDVTDRMIFTIQHKVSDGGFMLEDLRGKHHSHKTLPPELIDDIRKHIQSIPKIESHYVRATSTREYIDGGKTIKDLYSDFVKQQEENNKETGNYIAYYKIFTLEFNLSFFQPKKDQCDLCESFKNSTDEKKRELEDKYNKHIEEKSLSRIEKQEDRKKVTKDNIVAIYDLEAVLQCPRGDTSAFYYKSKLNSYNLTLTELTQTESKTAYDKVHCYFWTESEAKRGAIEIGTCVWQYLEGICESNIEEKNVTFYSDNCCGQNKNKYIATLYLFAVNTLNIRSIKHKFLITGHTQNEADSVHSLIEKEIKKNLKSGPIYSPDQYIALIKNAKKSKPAINVHELTFDSFVDTKILQEEWGYNYNTNMDGQTVNWNNIKVLMMKKEKPFSIFYKTSYKDDCFQEIDVRNKRKKMKLITEITLKKAYTERQDISLNKKKDLRDLVNKGLIPPFYANFYNSIIN
ncbi:unnamed protein product [Spodoptera exigua]|nr:unnamed protein product [Spodoptera exigua]